jgi:hypothetical protein
MPPNCLGHRSSRYAGRETSETEEPVGVLERIVGGPAREKSRNLSLGRWQRAGT